jgi:hypothetical protein
MYVVEENWDQDRQAGVDESSLKRLSAKPGLRGLSSRHAERACLRSRANTRQVYCVL